MKSKSADGQNESREWPQVPKIAGEEFQQSFAVAQLAVKLWEIKIAKLNLPPLEKQKLRDNPDFTQCLAEAWELIESAREHVLRPQTDAEYLVAHGGSHEAGEKVVWRRLSASRVPFEKLCDPERKKGATEMIELPDAETGKTIKVKWKVYRSERGFDSLFLDYWNATSEIKDAVKRKEYGQSLLASWKRYDVPPGHFLALAKFRREQDKRAANLKPKQKRKNRRTTVKSRVGARKHRTR